MVVTGKGGVGKTTVAAATAVRCAELGLDTCVVSTDTAHSLADVLDRAVGNDRTAICDGLEAVHIDGRTDLDWSWSLLHQLLVSLVERVGLRGVRATELGVVPGLDELVTLSQMVHLVADVPHDVVIVDCAPSAETIRLLSLPHVLGWWLDQLLPSSVEPRDVAPLVERGLGVPEAGRGVIEAARELLQRMRFAQRVLGNPDTTLVRLVTAAERVVVGETRRTAAYLSLFGYRIDAAIANRVDPRLEPTSAWGAEQNDQLERLRADLAPVPLLQLDRLGRPAVGLAALSELGRMLYDSEDPTGRMGSGQPMQFCGDQGERLHLSLPGVQTGDIELGRRGGDVHIRVGPYRRVVALPDSLAAVPVASAGIDGDELVVTFEVGGP